MIFLSHRPHPARLRVIAILFALLSAIGALLLLWPRSLAAQSSTRTAAVILLRGDDTVVVERIHRHGDTVTAMIAVRGAPTTGVTSILGANHLVTRASFNAWGAGAPTDGPPIQSASLRFADDSAHFTMRDPGGQERTQRIGTHREALLLVNNDFVAAEQVARRARALGVTKLTQPVFTLNGGRTLDATFDRFAPDSARFEIAGNTTVVSLDTAGNVAGGYLPAQGIRIVVVTGPAAAGISLGRPRYDAPADAPYTAQEVEVTTEAGHRLAGTLTLPRGVTGRVPAVVTITGSGAQDRDENLPLITGYRLFRQVADTLGRRGIAVLRLDDRGVGGSGGDLNGTTSDFAGDIRAGVQYLRTRAEVDAARIGLVGHSEGGIIAPMVAAEDRRLAAIVLMAGPAFRGREIIDYQIENGVRGDPSIAPAARDSLIREQRALFDSTMSKGAWMRFFLDYDPLPTARRVRQPVLILHGATDQQVRAVEAEMLDRTLREAGNRRVTMRIFPERNHLFLRDANGHPSGYTGLKDGRIDGEVLGALADWLVTTLGVR